MPFSALILLFVAAVALGISVRTERRRYIAKAIVRPTGKRRAPKGRRYSLAA